MRPRAVLAALACVACAAVLTPVAAADPLVGSIIEVSGDQTAQNETPIAVSSDGQHLVIGSNDWNANAGCGVNFSDDGGGTWTPTYPDGFVPGLTKTTDLPNVPGTGIYDVGGDPSVAIGSDGTVYFACLAYNNVTPPWNGVIYLSTTTDGGQHWQKYLVSTFKGKGVTRGSMGQGVDHDNLHLAANGDLYVTWAQFNGSTRSPILVAASHDGGQSWKVTQVTSATVRVNQDQRVVTDPDGNAYLVFDNALQGNKGFGLYVSKSTDHGATWSKPVQLATLDPVCLFPPDCFTISGDGQFRAGGSYPAPAFANGKLYVATAAMHDGYSQIDLYTVDPDTLAAEPVQHLTSGAADRFSAELAAAPGGRLDLSFYDRGYSSNELVDLTHMWSDDGSTWHTQRVTTDSYEFDPSKFGVPDSGTFRPFIGDYNGIVSTDCAAYMAWTGVGPDGDPVANPYNLEIEFAKAEYCG